MVAGLVFGTWACGAASELEKELERQTTPPDDAATEAPPPPPDAYIDTAYDAADAGEGGYDGGDAEGGYDVYPPLDVYPPPYDGPPPFDVYPPPYDGPPPFDVYPPPYDGYPPLDVYPPPYDAPDDVYPPFDVYPPPFDVVPPPVESGPPWDGGSPVAIATHESPVTLAVDDTYVYFENSGGTVLDCPVSGCPSNIPNLLAIDGAGYGLQSLAVGSSTAFYVNSSYSIDSCAGAGCGLAPTLYDGLADGGIYYFGAYGTIITDSSNTYFTDGSSVLSCPIAATCASPVTLHKVSAFATIGGLAVSGSTLFFVRDGTYNQSIDAIPTTGGTPTEVCHSTLLYSTTSMVVAGGYVYFTSGYAPGEIYQCPISGGASPSIYATDESPYGLATDGVNLYWTNNADPGTVGTCAVGATCTSPRTVATGQKYPQAIAVNSSAVFWSTVTDLYSAVK